MKILSVAAQASLVSVGLLLVGCGGGGSGGGGVGSTPNPVTYKKFDELTGNQTFKTAGVAVNGLSLSPRARYPYGTGVVARYLVTPDSIEIDLPQSGEGTISFTAADRDQVSQFADSISFSKLENNVSTFAAIWTPMVGGVPLSYVRGGLAGKVDLAALSGTSYAAVFGVPTQSGDMPKSGSASYSGKVQGVMVDTGSGFIYRFTPSSTVTLTSDFSAGSVSTQLTLVGDSGATGATPVNFGNFSGTGTIAASGPGFSGSFSSVNGAFEGAFFGPKAAEMGYAFNFDGASYRAVGVAAGKK